MTAEDHAQCHEGEPLTAEGVLPMDKHRERPQFSLRDETLSLIRASEAKSEVHIDSRSAECAAATRDRSTAGPSSSYSACNPLASDPPAIVDQVNRPKIGAGARFYDWLASENHVSAMLRPKEKNGWLEVSQKWGDEWSQKREEILDSFASIVEESKVVCSGAIVDTQSFRGMDLPKMKKRIQDPHYLAFEWTVMRSLEKVAWGNSDAVLGLVMDDDEEKSMQCYQLLKTLKASFPIAKESISRNLFCERRTLSGYPSGGYPRSRVPPTNAETRTSVTAICEADM